MTRQHFFTVSVFLVFSLALPGIVFGQRVIDLNQLWGDMRVLGDDNSDELGWGVAKGDINGDGYMDIIMGAPNADPGDPPRSYAGETYVIFCSDSPPSTIDLSTESADITIYGAAAEIRSGWAVDSGDVNGDGFDDIIIGAKWASPGGRNAAGETYVIFGDSFSSPPYTIDLSSTPADITVCGDDTGDLSGFGVASGNVNGDGYADVIIGAEGGAPGGRPAAGETYVIFGASFASPPYTIDLSTTPADITVSGDNSLDRSGWAVASGDINGDGYDDVIIGAYVADPGDPARTDAGETYVIFGASFASPPYTIDLSTTPADITVCGADAEDYFGIAVASGDVNGDGYDDVIIGAYFADPGDPPRDAAGETYVIFGYSPSSPVTIDLSTQSADITVLGSSVAYNLGWAVSSGDVNSDGLDDMIIAAPSMDKGGKIGRTYVLFGFNPPPYAVIIDLSTQSADITVCANYGNEHLGMHTASGDVNADGYDDIIIGARWASPGDPPRGMAGNTYLILGGGSLVTAHGLGGTSWIKQFSLLGRDRGSFKAFGAVNSQGEVHLAIGDIDADSRDEIAAGQGEGGKSWVKFFEVDGSPISTFKAFGAANTNGELHIALGNFDADASDEIVVAQGEGGSSWVKLFNADGTIMQSFKAFGAANAQGEVHVAAGDFNEDGIDEIVVGMGEGGSSRVKVFESPWGFLLSSFQAFDAADNPGGEVRLAVGNFDADADMEIAAATGYNGGNKVRLFEKDGTLIKQFLAFGFGGNPNGDVQIAAADIDNDGIWEIICGHGEGGSSAVKVFKPDGSLMLSFKAFGGVNAQGEVHLGRSNY